MSARVLSDASAAEIRRRYRRGGESFSSLAREFGVAVPTVKRAVFGQGAYANSKAAS